MFALIVVISAWFSWCWITKLWFIRCPQHVLNDHRCLFLISVTSPSLFAGYISLLLLYFLHPPTSKLYSWIKHLFWKWLPFAEMVAKNCWRWGLGGFKLINYYGNFLDKLINFAGIKQLNVGVMKQVLWYRIIIYVHLLREGHIGV